MKEIQSKILAWIDRAQIKTSKGTPFRFDQRPFLIEPLTDWHPVQGVNKCGQVGYSESVGVVKSGYAGQQLGMNIIYTLPTDNFVQKFVQSKVDPILHSNPHVFGGITGGVSIKEIPYQDSKRYWYFIGAFNPMSSSNKEETSKGISVTADLLIHDEASRSDQFVLQQLRSRIDDSDYRMRWLFDNPTYPGQGADAIYSKSDKRHWFIKCSHCNHWQYLEWERLDKTELSGQQDHCYVDTVQQQLVCSACMGVITSQDILAGQWVAKHQDVADKRGYWINQLMYPKKTIAEHIAEDDDPKLPTSHFQNFIMGKPYVGSDVKVSRSDIWKNITGEVNEKKNNAMGVDQGRILWYVIGNEQGIFKMGKTESWKEIEMLKRQYNCVVVEDNMPYTQPAKQLADKYPGEVFRATYNDPGHGPIARFGAHNDKSSVLIRRTAVIDEIVEKIQSGKLPIQVPESELGEFSQHWEAQTRIIQRDPSGNDRPIWLEVDDDHLSHATVYWYVAMLKLGRGSITVAPIARRA